MLSDDDDKARIEMMDEGYWMLIIVGVAGLLLLFVVVLLYCLCVVVALLLYCRCVVVVKSSRKCPTNGVLSSLPECCC